MVRHGIDIDHELIRAFCERNGIRRLALYGSILRDDFGPDSDVDVLVEFHAGQTPGLLQMAALETELSEMLGRRVDLRTPEELSRYFRQDVLDGCEVQYATG
jgi:predicted nucleotidyltransferase